MSALLQPGELVVRKQRWHINANLMGIVIGKEGDSWLVMWTLETKKLVFDWHLDDALLVVDQDVVPEVRARRSVSP